MVAAKISQPAASGPRRSARNECRHHVGRYPARRVASEETDQSRDPVPRITHYRTSVLHLRIVLRHLSIVEGYLRVLVRSLGHALAFPC